MRDYISYINPKNYGVILILLSSILAFSCGTSRLVYLQSARISNDKTYGITESNPILIKSYKSNEKEDIIAEYIERLWVGSIDSAFLIETGIEVMNIKNMSQLDFKKSNCKPVKKETLNVIH